MHADMNTIILILGFVLTIGSNTAACLYLGSRIDRLGDKLDSINLALGEHTSDIKTLKENQEKQNRKVIA